MRATSWGLALCVTLGLTGCAEPPPQPPHPAPHPASPQITTCLPPVAPAVTSALPSDTPINDQASVNCIAWQQFVALNWPADPDRAGEPAAVGSGDFGRPGRLEPVVWETYADIHRVMTADGSSPAPWGTPAPLPAACEGAGPGIRGLRHTSKFTETFEVPGDFDEAAPTGHPNWLADRDGNPVLYEILINRDEFDYVVQNAFYNATAQQTSTMSGTHINAPRGVLGGAAGSIEIKAAWLVVEDPNSPRWQRYKLSRALVTDGDDHCVARTVALVGLHIIHKTTSNPQWIWTTFEHVDNAPDQAAAASGKLDRDYTFFDPSCRPMAVPASCRAQTTATCKPVSPAPSQTTCTPNQPPAYCLDVGNPSCPPYPVQVTRVAPIADSGDNLVATLNAEMQALIRAQAGPDSIWQHYQLVGALWSGAPVDENLPGSAPPQGSLSIAGIRPDPIALPVANTTLETYVQNRTCISCHQHARIAGTGDDGVPEFNSDYSFVFRKANTAPQN